MKIEGIDHIHIFVNDLEGAMKFFSDIMGTKFIGPIDHRKSGAGRTIRVAFDNAGIELISPTIPDDPVAKYMEKLDGGEGLGSIGLRVPDIDEAIAELEAKGVKLERRASGPGIRVAIFYPENAYGVRLELVEYDTVRPIAVANVGMLNQLPWFESQSS